MTVQTTRRRVANVASVLIVLGITIYEIYTSTLRDKIDDVIKSADCPEFYLANLEYPKYAKELAIEDYNLQSNL